MSGNDRSKKGFAIRRRCDACGNVMSMALDTGDRCILICLHCGKEYRFICKAG